MEHRWNISLSIFNKIYMFYDTVFLNCVFCEVLILCIADWNLSTAIPERGKNNPLPIYIIRSRVRGCQNDECDSR